jgi:glycosyltransferase involved in cell wall biosynthesis
LEIASESLLRERIQSSPVNYSALIPKISVIMPAYNEQGRIRQSTLIARTYLDLLTIPYEIIIVDDGSTDRTREEAAACWKDSQVRVVGYGRNQGKGFATKFGAKYAAGDFVVFVDSDADISLDLIRQYVSVLDDNDIAIASKWHPSSQVSTPVLRKLLSRAFHCIVLLLTGVTVSDTQSGLKAFRGEALTEIMRLISVKRYAFDVEVLTVAKLLGLRIAELPVKIQLDSLFSIRHVLRMFVDLLGITYRLRVTRWYQANLHNSHAKYDHRIRC